MHEPKHTTADPRDTGHETSDANIGAVAKFGLGLAVLSVVALALMFALLKFFEKENTAAMPQPSPLAAQRQRPPGPRLQVRPEKDLVQLRAVEDSVLNGYGWVMREANIVRIPIDRAIELTAQRGLPARVEERESRIEERRSTMENEGSRP